jgi:stage II sporulation protein P
MLKKEPTIKYLIDIHRDSARYNKTLYEKNGKKYARIMFVVGLDHKNYEPNLKLANDLNSIIEEKYPRLSRGISKKTGRGVNGIYNQDMSPNSMLIEVGGVDNTIEEVNNTMEILSEVLSNYIKENDYGN